MMKFGQAMAALAMALPAGLAQAGSASLNVIVSVVVSSGACGASVGGNAVSVSCGSFANLPLLPPVGAGVTRPSASAPFGGSFGVTSPPFVSAAVVETQAAPASTPAGAAPGTQQPGSRQAAPEQAPPDQLPQDKVPADQLAEDEPPALQVGLLPAFGTGANPMGLYSRGANLSSWRVVSNDNVQHVELTIAW